MLEVVCGCTGKPTKENSRSCHCECLAMGVQGVQMHMFFRHYMRLQFARYAEESYEEKQNKMGGVAVKCNMSKERHASKIYRRPMFEQLGEMMYQAHAYRIEELEKSKLGDTHTGREA